jgi:HK97 family phage major capsid protein
MATIPAKPGIDHLASFLTKPRRVVYARLLFAPATARRQKQEQNLMSAAIKELLEKRAALVAQSREILERNKEAGKLGPEDQAAYDKIFGEVNTMTAEIEQRSSFADRQKQLDAAATWGSEVEKRNIDPNASQPEKRGTVEKKFKNVDGFERRASNPRATEAYDRYLKGSEGGVFNHAAEIEYRGILADTVGSGHDLIPPVEFIDQILIPRDRQVWIRKWATVRRLLKSTDGYQPTIETNPDDADWTTEVHAVNEDTGLTTGKRELKPNVLTKLVKVSIKELMVLPQVAGLIADRLGYKFGVTEEKAFMTGVGTTQPLGVFTASASGITTSQDVSTSNTSSAVTFDGLQAAKFALAPPYWANAKWVFHPTIMQMIATLKDSLGRYLWQPNTIVGQPDMLLGFPAQLDVWAPSTIAADAYVGILGDFSYYHIADLVEPFSVQRLNELYAGTNQVGFLGREYTDGMPVMSEAFVRVKLGASASS